MVWKKQTSEGWAPIEETEEIEEAPALIEGASQAQKTHWPRPRLPHFTDNVQRRAFANILRFLAVVLVFTLIARGTAGASMPKVQTVRPTSAQIVESVDASAVAVAARTIAIDAPIGLEIVQLLVVPGQTVQAGDAIVLFDVEEVTEQLARAQLQLENMELNLGRLERGEPYDNSALISAQSAYDWALQDQAAASSNGQALIDGAQRTLDAAIAEQEAAQDALDGLPSDATEEERAAAVQRLDDVKTAVTAAQTALDEARRLADEGNSAAARTAESAAQALAAAQTADAKARQGAADAAAQSAVDAETLRLDIGVQQRLLERFDAIGTDGKIVGTVEGVVLELAAEGSVTDETPLAKISDAGGGFRANATLPKAEATQLSTGESAEISLPGSYYDSSQYGSATLLSLSAPDASGMVQAVFSLPEGNWRQGQNLNLSVIKSQKDYLLCVPLVALRQDQAGYFVFVMEETSTVLGVENVARRVPVTLLARDNSNAAIEGALGLDAIVIGQTTKPLANGDKVRVSQT